MTAGQGEQAREREKNGGEYKGEEGEGGGGQEADINEPAARTVVTEG